MLGHIGDVNWSKQVKLHVYYIHRHNVNISKLKVGQYPNNDKYVQFSFVLFRVAFK